MWPWCLHCGRHLHDHTISDDPSWTSDALAGVLPAGATPSADGPHGTSSASGGEPAAHAAAHPVGSHSPTEDRVVDLMTALEESVAAAKAARQSTSKKTPRQPLNPAPGHDPQEMTP